MDQDRSDLNPPEENPLEQGAGGATRLPSQTDHRLPPKGSTGVADEGEDRGFGERPAGSEDGQPGSAFEPTPTEKGREEGDQGIGAGGD